MKHSIIATSLALALGTAAQASFAADAKLDSVEQKASYTLAYDLAKKFKEQGLDIDQAAFELGLGDGIKNAAPRLNPDEMTQAISEMKQKMMQKQLADREAKAKANIAAEAKFFADNGKKPGVKTLPSGIQYKVITEAKSGNSPTLDDTVIAHYEGRLLDGTVFDSSYERGNAFEFALGGVIKGWQEILQQMKTGDKWEVYIPSKLAYGERGAAPVIGPNEPLIFVIELISFKSAEK